MSRTDDIKAKLAQLRERQSALSGEFEELTARDALSEGDAERARNLNAGLTNIENEIEVLRAEQRGLIKAAVGQGAASGNLRIESGVPFETAAPARADRAGSRPFTGPFAAERREAVAVLHRSDAVSDELAERVARMVEADERSPLTAIYATAAADPDYARAFAKLCRDPLNGHRSFTARELEAYQRAEYALRALDLSTGAAMLPTHLDANILLSGDGITSPFRQVARVETGVHQEWNGVSSAGVTSAWTAEAAEVGDDAPSFATPTVTAFKATSFVPVSFEALGDMALDGIGGASVGHGAGQLGELFEDARAVHEGTAFTTGNGTTAPRGLITALDANTNVEVPNITDNTFAAGDVYALIEALPPRFRARASWMADLAIINNAAQFETTNGAKLFPGLDDAEATLLRRRVYENSEMDGAIDVGGTDNILVVGDFRQYLVYDRVPSQLELVPHLFHADNNRPSGQRGFLYWYRVGGNTLVDNAFRLLQAETN